MAKKTDQISEAESAQVGPDEAEQEISAADKGFIVQPTPIIITGGSLTIESINVDFGQFVPDGTRKLKHPRNSRVISVDIFDGDTITLPPRVTYVPPSNGRFIIVVNY